MSAELCSLRSLSDKIFVTLVTKLEHKTWPHLTFFDFSESTFNPLMTFKIGWQQTSVWLATVNYRSFRMGHVVIGCFHQKWNNRIGCLFGGHDDRFWYLNTVKVISKMVFWLIETILSFFYSCSFHKYSKIENAKTKKAAIFNTFSARHVMAIQFEIFLIRSCSIRFWNWSFLSCF